MAIQVHGNNSANFYKKLFVSELASLYPENEINSLFRLVLADILQYPYNTTNNIINLRFSESEILLLHNALTKLKLGIPLQHISGFTEFFDLKIHVNRHVLIPRPETEYLIHLISKLHVKPVKTVLDVCCGSGCIALALKKIFSEANVSAYELSPEAINVSKQNADENNLSINIHVLDVLKDDWPDNSVDLIVSNPPYIPQNEIDEIDDNVFKHEPKMALLVDNDKALIFYETILKKAQKLLTIKGAVYFEINPNYAHNLLSLATKLGFDANIHKDLENKDRFLHCQWPAA